MSKTEALESAQAYLRKCDASGRSLHDHLTDVLLTIAKERPSNPLNAFESISVRVKESFHPVSHQLDHHAENNHINNKSVGPSDLSSLDAASKAALLATVQRTASLLKPESSPEETEQEWDSTGFPDLVQQSKLLEWAGFSLGEEEVYQINLSLQQLASKESLVNVRLFGKIFGSQRDYIIAEAKLAGGHSEAESEPNSKDEPAGAGVNEFTYFVCSSPGSSWIALPNVTVKMIKKARNMRRFFTGNLSSSVPGYPYFPWSEAHYLRAQIARIVATTTVAPKGFYSLNSDEETPVVIEDEEFKGVSAGELLSSENWTHARPFLNKQGRLTKWVAPEKEEEEDAETAEAKPKTPEQEEDEVDAAEEDVEQLRALSEDSSSSWSFRVAPSLSSASPLPHTVAVARSLAWPGAVTAVVGASKQLVSFYVGYGQKSLGAGKTYTPPQIPPILGEFVLEQKSEEDDTIVNLLEEQTDPLPPPPKTVEELAAEQAENGDTNNEDEENGNQDDQEEAADDE